MGRNFTKTQDLWFTLKEIRQDGFGETEEMSGRRTKTKRRHQTFIISFKL